VQSTSKVRTLWQIIYKVIQKKNGLGFDEKFDQCFFVVNGNNIIGV
jgi:hypothetical protein